MIMRPVQYAHQTQVEQSQQPGSEAPIQIRQVTGQSQADQYRQVERTGATTQRGASAQLDQKALENNLQSMVQGIQEVGQSQPEAAAALQGAIVEIGQGVLKAEGHPGGLPAVQRQLMPKVERLRRMMQGAGSAALEQLAAQEPHALLTAIGVLVKQMSEAQR